MLEHLRQLILELTPGEYPWVFSIAAVICLVAFVFGLRSILRARVIMDTPTSRIRSAAQGYVELEGMARPVGDELLRAPLSGYECVWYDARVERREQVHTKNGTRTRWVEIERSISGEPIGIDDGTGEALILPNGARTYPVYRRVWYGSSPRPALGVGGERLFFGRKYRYTERLIREHEPLYVIGEFSTSYRDIASERAERVRILLSEWKNDPEQMKRFDLDGDGRIDEREWDMARRLATATARKEMVVEAANSDGIHIMRRPHDGRPFILSAIPQKKLIRRKMSVGLGLWGLSTLTVALLAYMNQLRGWPF
ncbi:MAG: GIDE domain-containing protein [Halothiobacillaceae bacterium]